MLIWQKRIESWIMLALNQSWLINQGSCIYSALQTWLHPGPSSFLYSADPWTNPIKFYLFHLQSSCRFSADLNPSIRRLRLRLSAPPPPPRCCCSPPPPSSFTSLQQQWLWHDNWSDHYSVRPISSAAVIGRRVAMQPVSCAQGKALRVKQQSVACCCIIIIGSLCADRGELRSHAGLSTNLFPGDLNKLRQKQKHDKHPDESLRVREIWFSEHFEQLLVEWNRRSSDWDPPWSFPL